METPKVPVWAQLVPKTKTIVNVVVQLHSNAANVWPFPAQICGQYICFLLCQANCWSLFKTKHKTLNAQIGLFAAQI